MTITTTSLLGVLVMWATTILFTVWAVERKTIFPTGLSCVLWLINALMFFLADPLGVGPWMAWLFGSIGVFFIFELYRILEKQLTDDRHAQYRVGEPL